MPRYLNSKYYLTKQHMNIFTLIVFTIFGYWIVHKLALSKKPHPDNALQRTRSWFEVLDLPEGSSDDQIEARYKELIAIYTHEEIAELEAELQAEALAYRNEIEHAYYSASFRRQRK